MTAICAPFGSEGTSLHLRSAALTAWHWPACCAQADVAKSASTIALAFSIFISSSRLWDGREHFSAPGGAPGVTQRDKKRDNVPQGGAGSELRVLAAPAAQGARPDPGGARPGGELLALRHPQ